MNKLTVKLEGVAPLLMHNGHLADPLNDHVKALKKVTGKRKKSDEDHREIADLEYLGSLYVDEKGRPVIPGENIESTLVAAAKKSRMGKQAQSSIFCEGPFLLQYKGPKTSQALVKDPAFRDVRCVKVQSARIMRTRPRFDQWALEIDIFYTDEFNEDQILDLLKVAGTEIGLCDYRPKFGRFVVK